MADCGLGRRVCATGRRFPSWCCAARGTITNALDEFTRWINATAQVTQLYNPAEIVHWNLDKQYLAQLIAAGIRCDVDNVFIELG